MAQLSAPAKTAVAAVATFTAICALTLTAVYVANAWFAKQINANQQAYLHRHEDALLAQLRQTGVSAQQGSQQGLEVALPAVRIQQLSAVHNAKQAEPVAVLLRAVASEGYAGEIHFLLLKIRGQKLPLLRVVEHRETPGIADFLTTTPAKIYDGISGATITRNALLRAVREAEQWLVRCWQWQTATVAC